MKDIMLNHHEQQDGGGFLGKTGDQLSAPVRLACTSRALTVTGYRARISATVIFRWKANCAYAQ